MSKPGVTFAVSDVKRATVPLPEAPYHQAVADMLGRPLADRKAMLREQVEMAQRYGGPSGDEPRWLAESRQALAEVEAAEAAGPGRVEAVCRYHGRLVADVLAHPVIVALHRAFMQHRPLALSPNMVWLLVCQGVANHVNAHAEELRPRFVSHQGKARILVRRDDFVKGSPENPWGEVIDAFSAQVAQHIGPAHGLFVPRFSTTGPTERIAAEVVLLDAMQSYFDYVLRTMCGIPAITLEGTPQDWEQVAERAEAFAGYGLEWWLTPLRPVLRQFVAASRGKVDAPFWRSIYKFETHSGGATVTGWVPLFFPYLKDAHGLATVRNPWLAEGGDRLRRLLGGRRDPHSLGSDGPSPGAFPGGLARAPFKWEYFHQTFDMELLGGFVGVGQDEALTLRPEIGWAVRQA
jgi:hypothetical protein